MSWGGSSRASSRKTWAAGWPRSDAPPPDLGPPRAAARVAGLAVDRPTIAASPGGYGWREAGVVGGPRWQALHADREAIVRDLRRAGYSARRWSRRQDGWHRRGGHRTPRLRYLDGPAQGAEAVDPWTIALRLRHCSARWYVSLRWAAGGLSALPVPLRCGQRHVCPVCAAGDGRALAARLEAATAGYDDLALVTLTHRDVGGEPLTAALARLQGAWRRLTRGRPGQAWRQRVAGAYWGMEVTRSWAGRHATPPVPRPRAARARWWHAHLHVVVALQPGAGHDDAREWLAARWQAASAAAGRDAGHSDGGCDAASQRDGGWWRVLRRAGEDVRAGSHVCSPVYQAAKYPCPVSDLRGEGRALAEWVAVAWGRRWHGGTGALRSLPGLDRGDDVGVNLGIMSPGAAPLLDQVDPSLGWAGGDHPPPPLDDDDMVRWALAGSSQVELDEVEAAAAAVGGGIEWGPAPHQPDDDAETVCPWVVVPAREVRAWVRQQTARHRQRHEEDRARRYAAALAEIEAATRSLA